MTEPSFDIFSGTPDKSPVWIESIRGLSKARAEMERIAEKTPGRYFLFSAASNGILVQIETFEKTKTSSARARGAA
jgi:hypothetical protein